MSALAHQPERRATYAEQARQRGIKPADGTCCICRRKGPVTRFYSESPHSYDMRVFSLCETCRTYDAYPPLEAVPKTTAPAVAAAGA